MIISMSTRRICLDAETDKLLIYDHSDACVVAQLTHSQMKGLIGELADKVAEVEEQNTVDESKWETSDEAIHAKHMNDTMDFVHKKLGL